MMRKLDWLSIILAILVLIAFILMIRWMDNHDAVIKNYEPQPTKRGTVELEPLSLRAVPDLESATTLQPAVIGYSYFPVILAKPLPAYREEEREDYIDYFCVRYHWPICSEVDTLVKVADTYGLQPYLLGSLAVVESGGCRASYGNNCWGFGNYRFDNVASGIEYVGQSLAGKGKDGGFYAGRTLEGKLFSYNQHEGYYQKVVWVMQDIKND